MAKINQLTRLCFVFLIMVGILFDAAPTYAQTVIRDTEIEAALEEITVPIIRTANLNPNDVRFVLLQNPTINAFVMGGQTVFLNTGFLIATNNADQFAGVFAHELAHIAAGHVVRTQNYIEESTIQQILAGLAAAALSVATGESAAGSAVLSASNQLSQRSFLAHTRTLEANADQSAIQFLNDANYPTVGLYQFLQKLYQMEQQRLTITNEYLRTHPLSINRIRQLESKVTQSPKINTKLQSDYTLAIAKMRGYLDPQATLEHQTTDTEAGHYQIAIAKYRSGKLQESYQMLQNLHEQNPDHIYYSEMSAQILHEQRKLDQAAQTYEQILNTTDPLPLIRIAYARVLVDINTQQSLAKAKRELTSILTVKSLPAQAYRLLAIIAGRQDQKGPFHYYMAEHDFARGDLHRAQDNITRAEKSLSDDSDLLLRLQDLKTTLETRLAKLKN